MGNSRTIAPKYYKVCVTRTRVRANPRVQQRKRCKGKDKHAVHAYSKPRGREGEKERDRNLYNPKHEMCLKTFIEQNEYHGPPIPLGLQNFDEMGMSWICGIHVCLAAAVLIGGKS